MSLVSPIPKIIFLWGGAFVVCKCWHPKALQQHMTHDSQTSHLRFNTFSENWHLVYYFRYLQMD